MNLQRFVQSKRTRMLATALLLTVIAIQTISLHRVDTLLNTRVMGLRTVRFIELSSTLLAALPLLLHLRAKPFK